MHESDEDFYKRIEIKLKQEEELGKRQFVDDLDEFIENYPQLYDEILDEIIGYSARLARKAQLTISLLLSSFEIRLCLEDVTKSTKLVSNKLSFVLYVNINYWLSLGNVNDNFNKKSAVLKERVSSFYMLHLLLSKSKDPKLWSLCSELETAQYLTDDELAELEPWSSEDVGRMLELELPSDGTAQEYYDLIADDINSKSDDDQTLMVFTEAIGNSKHNDNRFDANISNESDEVEHKAMVQQVLENINDLVSQANSSDRNQDKSWGHFSSRIHSIIEVLIPPKPLADYKTMLRRVVGKVKGSKRLSYSRPNRYKDYIAKGSITSKNEPHVLIGIDVSGSMDDKEIIVALGEICHIKKGKITLMQFDTQLVSKQTFLPHQWKKMIADGYVLNARGGTDFKVIIEEYQNNLFSMRNKDGYSYLIVFTDGGCEPYAPLLDNGEVNTTAMNKIRWMITEHGTNKYIKEMYSDESILYLHEKTYINDKK